MPETTPPATLVLPPEGSPPWQERHHRCRDMVHAREMSKMLTEMASFLDADADQKLWGGQGTTIRDVWFDCAIYFRDYYALKAPYWMRTRLQRMDQRVWALEREARKHGYNEFTFDDEPLERN